MKSSKQSSIWTTTTNPIKSKYVNLVKLLVWSSSFCRLLVGSYKLSFAFTSKDPNGILINAIIINQGDMSKEYLDLKFIYHYDESLPNKIPLKIIAPNHLLETNLQASKE